MTDRLAGHCSFLRAFFLLPLTEILHLSCEYNPSVIIALSFSLRMSIESFLSTLEGALASLIPTDIGY